MPNQVKMMTKIVAKVTKVVPRGNMFAPLDDFSDPFVVEIFPGVLVVLSEDGLSPISTAGLPSGESVNWLHYLANLPPVYL